MNTVAQPNLFFLHMHNYQYSLMQREAELLLANSASASVFLQLNPRLLDSSRKTKGY